MRTSNPVFASIERSSTYTDASAASYAGITLKTFILFGVAILSGYLSLMYVPVESYMTLIFVSLIVGLIAVFVGSYRVNLAMPAAFVYALAEGVVLGLITMVAEAFAPGAAVAAIVATVAIFFVMLFLYSSRIIRVTTRFRKVMYTILFGILFFFILSGLLQLFTGFSFMMTSGSFNGIALAITGFMIIYGAFLLTLDFDRAEAIVSGGADKKYEWVITIGLMVTIIWLYIEILRLIIILSSRNR
jgi:uncharacterized YccA/Bax inhibitor family protein